MLVYMMLAQRPLNCPQFFLFFYLFFVQPRWFFTSLSISLLNHFSVSSNQLLILSSIFFILVIVQGIENLSHDFLAIQNKPVFPSPLFLSWHPSLLYLWLSSRERDREIGLLVTVLVTVLMTYLLTSCLNLDTLSDFAKALYHLGKIGIIVMPTL